MATRLALGASPARLATRTLRGKPPAGGLRGASPASWPPRSRFPLLVRLSPEDVPRLQDAAIDLRVLGFALVTLLATAAARGPGSDAARPKSLRGDDASRGLAECGREPQSTPRGPGRFRGGDRPRPARGGGPPGPQLRRASARSPGLPAGAGLECRRVRTRALFHPAPVAPVLPGRATPGAGRAGSRVRGHGESTPARSARPAGTTRSRSRANPRPRRG